MKGLCQESGIYSFFLFVKPITNCILFVLNNVITPVAYMIMNIPQARPVMHSPASIQCHQLGNKLKSCYFYFVIISSILFIEEIDNCFCSEEGKTTGFLSCSNISSSNFCGYEKCPPHSVTYCSTFFFP